MNRSPKVMDLIRSDLARYTSAEPAFVEYARTALRNPGFLASVILRVQQGSVAKGHSRRASAARHLSLALTGADFVPGCDVGPGLLLNHPSGVVLGNGASVGSNCTILQNVTLGERFVDGRGAHDYPTVGDEVTLGAGACVLGAVKIGNGATVGANSVVLTDVPDMSLAVGTPARVIPSHEDGGMTDV